MPYTVTAYNVMIGSPSDVQERKLVENILAKWNHKHGEEKKLVFLPLKWEDDSYPDAAGRPPQKILNQQICERSDMLIAIFWTKLGSPTDEYDSGTIEEINVHMNEGKQVFIYFCEKEIPEGTDEEQYKKLKKYRTDLEMSQSVFYSTYLSEQDLEDKLLAHLDNMVAHKRLGTVEVVQKKRTEPKLRVSFDGRYEIRVEYENPMLMSNRMYSDEECKKSLEILGRIEKSLKQEENDLLRILHDDIPQYLQPYMQKQDVDKFFEKYNSESDIEAYIESWENYLLADSAKKLVLQIENDGPGIANDILVEIESPQEHLLIVDMDTYEEMHTFQCGINPIDRARTRYAEKHNAALAFAKQARQTVAKTRYIPFAGMPSARYDYSSILGQSGYYLDYKEGILKAHCKKLTYEHQYIFSDPVYIIPTAPGKGKIKVSYSCDQFNRCKHSTIEYEVKEL